MKLADFKPPRQLTNIKEAFWYETFYANQACPECENKNDMIVTMTMKSVRVTCQACKKMFFYRRVNLGVIE